MKYRPLDANGDYTVGVPFLTNSPECVAQAILTRLKLWEGEWFVNTNDGTPYFTDILGPRADTNPDAAIQQRILGTPGVSQMSAYSGFYDGTSRVYHVTATVDTIYGVTTISTALS